MSKEPQTHDLKIVSGVSIGGKIFAPGKVALAVPEKLARDLLQRGKAELASDDDVKAAAKAEKAAAKAAADAEAEAKAKADADAAKAAAKAAADKTPTPDKDQTK